MLRNHTLAAMEPSDLAALLPDLIERHIGRGVVLTGQGDAVEHLYFPTTAYLANTVTFLDGRSALTFVMGREGVAGLAPFLAEETSAWGVEVRSEGGVYQLPVAALRRRLDVSPDLRRQLQRQTYDYQTQAAYGVGCAALHSVTPRLAALVLKSADRLGCDRLDLTQQDIAEFLGMQRTTVNAAARQLKETGAIRYSRGKIRILDRDRLIAGACECYAATRRLAVAA